MFLWQKLQCNCMHIIIILLGVVVKYNCINSDYYWEQRRFLRRVLLHEARMWKKPLVEIQRRLQKSRRVVQGALERDSHHSNNCNRSSISYSCCCCFWWFSFSSSVNYNFDYFWNISRYSLNYRNCDKLYSCCNSDTFNSWIKYNIELFLFHWFYL